MTISSDRNKSAPGALIKAVQSRGVKSLRTALESDVDVNVVVRGYTALGLAVENGSTREVKVLLAAGADPDHGGMIDPLHEAVQAKRFMIVEALLQAGADVNRKIENGTTPLMMAVFTSSAKAVQLLLDAGADAKLENDNQECAFEIALEHRKRKIAEVLAPVSNTLIEQTLHSGLAIEKLIEAAQRGDIVELRRIIATGIDVNGFAPMVSDTALAEASWNGHLDMVIFLLEAGASPNIYGYWPPLAKAASRGNIRIIQRLLEVDAVVDALSADDETALMRAAQGAFIEASKILLVAGANVNACGRIGKTPLSQAYDYEWRYRTRNPVVDLLLDQGADNLGAYEKFYSNWKRPEQ